MFLFRYISMHNDRKNDHALCDQDMFHVKHCAYYFKQPQNMFHVKHYDPNILKILA